MEFLQVKEVAGKELGKEIVKESKKSTFGQWHIVYDEYSLCFASKFENFPTITN